MPYFEWRAEFETGVASVDQQHKRLVSLINQLHDALAGDVDQDQIQETLNELVDYTRFHFADEERLMADVPEHDVEKHKEQHRAFVTELTNLMLQYGETGTLTGAQLTSFLKGWLQEHFLKDDKRFIEQYVQRRKTAQQQP